MGNVAPDRQAEYWAALETYERSLAAKRQKLRAQLPTAERYEAPARPAEAAASAATVEPAAAAAVESDDLADVSTDQENFVDDSQPSQEGDAKGAAEAAGPSDVPVAKEESAEQAAVVTLTNRYAPPGREGWADRKKHMYACQAGGPQVLEQNERIALQLDKLSEKYKTQQPGEWRQYTYSKAAKIVRGLSFAVTSASQVREVKGIGDKVAAKIQEIIDTGGRGANVERAGCGATAHCSWPPGADSPGSWLRRALGTSCRAPGPWGRLRCGP